MIFAQPQPAFTLRTPLYSMPRCLLVVQDPSSMGRGESHPKSDSAPVAVGPTNEAQNQAKEQDRQPGDKVVYQTRGVVVTRADTGALTFTVDLPGVRVEDVVVECNPSHLTITAERKANGKTTSKFSQQYSLTSALVDVDGARGIMEDGVLSIVLPTKEPTKAYDIPLLATYAPEQDEEQSKKTFQFTIDLPGVKSSDLKVAYDDNKILVKGERKRSSGAYKIDKYVPVDPTRIDTSKLESFLADGVLTVRAPLVKETHGKRVELYASQPVAGLVGTERSKKDEEFEIVVENADDEETVKA